MGCQFWRDLTTKICPTINGDFFRFQDSVLGRINISSQRWYDRSGGNFTHGQKNAGQQSLQFFGQFVLRQTSKGWNSEGSRCNFFSSIYFVNFAENFVKYYILGVFQPMVDGSRVPAERYLALGAIIRRYISDYPKADSPVLTNLLEKLSSPIKKGCLCRTVEEEDLVSNSTGI